MIHLSQTPPPVADNSGHVASFLGFLLAVAIVVGIYLYNRRKGKKDDQETP